MTGRAHKAFPRPPWSETKPSWSSRSPLEQHREHLDPREDQLADTFADTFEDGPRLPLEKAPSVEGESPGQ